MAVRPVVEIEIGEVVLHDFAPGARAPLGDALAAELERLLSDAPALASGLDASPSVVRLSAGVPLTAGEPAAAGAAVARAVAGGWSR